MIRFATPPVDINEDAKMKNGMANKVYFCDAVKSSCATEATETCDKNAITKTLDNPKETATGTPRNKNRNSKKNKITVIMISP